VVGCGTSAGGGVAESKRKSKSAASSGAVGRWWRSVCRAAVCDVGKSEKRSKQRRGQAVAAVGLPGGGPRCGRRAKSAANSGAGRAVAAAGLPGGGLRRGLAGLSAVIEEMSRLRRL
jgi:hypothetical protein